MSPEGYKKLIDSILEIMIHNCIAATTMDNIASKLKISKRTLYEIFSSKEQLTGLIIDTYNNNQAKMHLEIARKSKNEIDTLLNIFLKWRNIMSEMDINFYIDMDKYYENASLNSRETQFEYLNNMAEIIQQGKMKGFFRDNINYSLQLRMLVLQMETLKKIEDTFPKDITLFDIYDTVSISFLRAIVTQKGMEILDDIIKKHREITNHDNHG